MWVLSASDKFVIDFRRALLPFSLGLLLVVHLAFHPPLGVMLFLCTLLPIYLVVQRVWSARAIARLDRDFSLLLMKRDIDGLHALLRRERWLRWFGPPGVTDEKRGLIASLENNWSEANRLLERAYLRAGESRRPALLPPLLRAKYETGQSDEAERIARRLLGRSPFPSAAELFLGLILSRRPEHREEGICLLRRAQETLGPQDRARASRALQELEAKGAEPEEPPGSKARTGGEEVPEEVA